MSMSKFIRKVFFFVLFSFLYFTKGERRQTLLDTGGGRRRLRKGELLFHTCGPMPNIRQFPRNRATLQSCFSGKLSNLVLVKRKEEGGGRKDGIGAGQKMPCWQQDERGGGGKGRWQMSTWYGIKHKFIK